MRRRDQTALPFCTNRRTLIAGALAGMAAPALARAPQEDSIDSFVTAQIRAGGIPGMAIGVARAGRVVLTRGYGFADLARRRSVTIDTMFHLASVTKTITATAVVMLAEAGKLDLDAPADRYLDFQVRNPAFPDAAITLRHLLMHVSGLSDQTYYDVDFRTRGQDSPLPLGAFLKDYLVPGGRHYSDKGSFNASAPGAAYDYSNVGYGLLGYMAGRVAGQDFRTFTRERIFDPLGMGHMSWTLAQVPESLRAVPYDSVDGRPVPVLPVGFPDYPTGMLRASIGALMPFVAAAANGGATGTARILTAAGQAEMLAMHVPPGLPSWLSGQGLGWMESREAGKRRINHWGGDPGVFTAVYLDPASGTGIAILTNASATSESKAALKAVAERLLEGAAA